MSRSVRFIYGELFLVASMSWSDLSPRLAAIGGVPNIVAKKRLIDVRSETKIEKFPGLIAVRHRIAAKQTRFQNTGELPGHAAIGGITPAGLPEVGLNAVKLPPADHHLVVICRINRNRGLVCSIAEDVVTICVDVCLKAGEQAELRSHSGRSLYFSRRSRRIIIFFQRLIQGQLVNGRQLS